MRKTFLFFLFVLIVSSANSQINIPATTIVTENFNSIGNTASAILPANWKMSSAGTGSTSGWSTGTNITATTQAASSGTPTAGGAYNWATTSGADRAIGFMTDGSYSSPNSIMAFYRNTTGATVSTLTITFAIERYRINTAPFTLSFFSSIDGSTWTARTTGDVTAATFTTAASSYSFASPQTVFKTVTISGLSIVNNGDYYLRWLLTTTNSNSQGLALDNVSVYAGAATPSIIATMRDALTIDGGVIGQANPDDQLTYTTTIKNTGTGDANNVNLTAPAPTNTTLVSGSVKTSALARNDAYSTPFNTLLNAATVLTNDYGLPSVTVISFGPTSNSVTTANGVNSASTDNGGTVVMNTDGTFTYTPPSGFTGNDKFAYIAGTGTLPNNDAVVSIAVGSVPTANNDSYNVIGNVSILPNASLGVLNNDAGTGITIVAVNGNAANVGSAILTSNNGNLTVNADGSFTYNPSAGFEGSDNFTYTIDNGFSAPVTATVTLNIAGMVWFINNGGAAGDGRLSSPFNSIAAFQAVNNGTGNNPAANDNIFLYENGTSYTNPAITLLTGQKLIGQDASVSLATITGLTPASYSSPFPVMNPGAGSVNLVNAGTIVTLSTGGGNLLHGITLTPSAGNAVLLSGTALGNHTFTELTIFSAISANGINLAATSYSGTVTYNSGSFINSGTGTAITINGNSATVTCNVSITQSGNGSMVNITNHTTGTVTFQTGTLTASNGNGLQFTNADGMYNFNGTTNLNGGDAGIDITNGSAGTFIFSANTSITSPAGTAFNVDGTITPITANITYSGNITHITAAQRMININTTGSGTITFQTGTLTPGSASTGINLNAVNGNVIFVNGLSMGNSVSRMTNQPLTITGGTGTYSLGAVSIYSTGVSAIVATNADGTINCTSGLVDAVNATAINISGPAGITSLGVTLTTVNSTGGVNNIQLSNCSGTSVLGTGSLSGATGASISFSGGTVTATYSGNITQSNNAALVSVTGGHSTGTITFQTGTLSATNGTGLQFDNADGIYTFTGTCTLNGGDAGIDIINGSSGNFSFSNAAITNPTGVALLVNGVNGTITHSGAISKTSAGRLIDIQARTGGSVTINGNLSSTVSSTGINVSGCTGGTISFAGSSKTLNTPGSNPVNLATNTGATINFTNGGLAITSTTATGFNATGGGTINVIGTANIITSTTGSALNVANTTIGASGLNFQSISSTGGTATGIILDNTGSSGGLVVSGDGTNTSLGGNSSGGTISGKSGADGSTTTGIGIYLNNTTGVTLRRMTVTGTNQNFGLLGTGNTNLVVQYCTVSGVNGNNVATTPREGSVILNNLFGTSSIQNSIVSGGIEDNIRVENTSGTLTSFTLSNSTIQNNSTVSGNIGFRFATVTAGVTMTGTVTGCTFQGNRSESINSDASNGTVNITITNNTIIAGTGGNNQGNLGINVSTANAGVINYTIENNRVGTDGVTNQPLLNTGINIFAGGTTCIASGSIKNNTVYNAGTGFSGHGIQIFSSGTSAPGLTTIIATVTGNTVSNVGLDFGIRCEASGTAAASILKLRLSGNNVSVLSTALDAIRVTSRLTSTVCAIISGNTTNSGGTGFVGLFVRQANTAVFQLEGLAAGSQTAATTQTYVVAQNPAAATVGAVAITNFTGVITGFCAVPN